MLRNIAYGQGPHFLSQEARQKLSVFSSRPRPAGFSEKIKRAQKERWDSMTPERRAEMRGILKRAAAQIPREIRQAIGLKGAEWQRDNWTAEDRAKRSAKISATLKANPEAQSEAGKKAARIIRHKYPGHQKKLTAAAQKFWQELKADPERYRAHVLALGEKISAAKKTRPDSWPNRDQTTGRFLPGAVKAVRE